MEHMKRHLRSLGALTVAVVIAVGSFSNAFASETGYDSFSALVTSTDKWSYGTKGEVTNDFLETIRTSVLPSVREDITNQGKFSVFQAVIPKLAKMHSTPTELLYKDGVVVDASLEGSAVSKSIPKEWLVKDGDWTISCAFDGCISNDAVNPTELYPKMDSFRKSVVAPLKKLDAIKDKKKLQSLSKSLKKKLTGKAKMTNKQYTIAYITYLVVNEKLTSMK